MKPGFTLLELLIAIVIFAGVMIIALAIFARTANTAAKSNISREKTELARSVVDQISNDFRYTDESQTPPGCPAAPAEPAGGKWLGFCLDPLTNVANSVHLLLKYPGDTTFTARTYYTVVSAGLTYLRVNEKRGCVAATDCTPSDADGRDLLPSTYTLDSSTIFTAQTTTATQKGFLGVNVTLRPATSVTSCNTLSAGSCYGLSTTLVPGGLQ